MCSVMSDFFAIHGLRPTRLLCQWDFPIKNTGEGCHFLLQGNPPNPGIELMSPALQVHCLPLSYQRSPAKQHSVR